MANSDKNILITPNTNQSDQPKIEFVGSGSNTITLNVLDDNSLSWEGSEGQLFSITPVLSTGSIFSVNDISGIPSIDVDADGTVSLAEFSGNVGVGTASPTHKLTVNGTVSGSTALFTTITASSIQGTVAGGVTTTNISSYATTGVTAGTGLSGGGTVGTLTLNLDFSELTDKTSDIAGTTEFILQDGTTESRKAASEIKLSYFNNDSGWTSNAGDITSVVAGNGLTGGATSGDATLTVGAGTGITVNASDVAINSSVVPTLSATNTFTSRNTFSDITVDTTTLKTDGSNDAVEVGAATTTSGTPGKLRVKSAESTRTGGGLHIYNYGDSFRAWYMWQTGSTDSYKLYFGHYNQSSTPIYFDTTGSIYADGYYYGDGSKLQNLPAPSTIPITNASAENSYRYLTFVDSTSGNQIPKVDSALYYWPAQDRLFAGSFSGDGSNLSNVSVGVGDVSSTASPHYLLLSTTTSSAGTSAKSAGNLVFNPYYRTLGVGTNSPNTNQNSSFLRNRIHLVGAGTSGGTPNAFGHLVLENSYSTYINFMVPSSMGSGLLFGDNAASNVAQFIYSHTDDSMSHEIPSGGYFLNKIGGSFKSYLDSSLFQLYTGVGFKADGGSLTYDATNNRLGVSTGTITPSVMLDIRENRATNPAGYFRNTNADGYGIYVAAGASDGTTGYLIRFLNSSLSFIANITHINGAVTYGAFTGNHPAMIPDFEQETYEYGTIVKVESSQLAGNTNQPLFVCSKTTSAKQKSAFGVYAAKEDQEGIHSIFALGDGHILVNAEGGDIEIGDYICSSNTAGTGMKQDDDLLHSYTVAKAAENVVWADETESVKLIICTYHGA